MNIDDNSVESVYRSLRQRLAALTGSDGEATAMARLIFHSLKGWNTTDLVIHAPDRLSEFTLERIDNIMERLGNHEPLQYILGEGRVYGIDLRVTPDTLIPRPETEELVEMIVERADGRSDLRVLDIGTGSGAIAIALARNLRFPQISALDISEGALDVARDNARRLHADIRFLHADILTYDPPRHSLDIIVSNPPYIALKERAEMEPHVKDHEPARALFVPDDDPLLFYRRILTIGLDALTGAGRVYFEINPLYASELKQMMQQMGYDGVELHKDISGRLRFASGELGVGS